MVSQGEMAQCLIHLRSDAGPWQILSPPIAVDTMLRTRGVAQYQIVHLRQNELEVRYLPLKGADPRQVVESIQEQFISVLSGLGCVRSVSVRVTQVERFERAGVGGKLQQMISLVSAPAAATWATRPGSHFSARD